MNPLLSVQDLTVRFGSLTAVDRISLGVARGQILGVLGPNGAGKSTLFNAITGHARAAAGDVFFEGQRITGLSPDRIARLGLVRTFQATRAFANMTVGENVMAGAYLRGRTGLAGAALNTRRALTEDRQVAALAADYLGALGIGQLAGLAPSALTAGQLRLAEIARALATGARCLLLDEPAAGLSGAETQALAAQLRELRKEGLTMILVEHDVEFVLDISDAVCVLDFGALLATGSPAEVAHSAAVREAYLGETAP